MKTSTTPTPPGVTGERTPRTTIPPRVRFEVFKRDGFRCRYCGASADVAALHVDHGVPLVAGGADEIANYVTACHLCNSGKGPISLHVPGRIPKPRRPTDPNDRRADGRCPVHGSKMVNEGDYYYTMARRQWGILHCPRRWKGNCNERAVIIVGTDRVEWWDVDALRAVSGHGEPGVSVPPSWWDAITSALPRPWPVEAVKADLTLTPDANVVQTGEAAFARRWGWPAADVAAILRRWDWREEVPG